MNSSSIKYCFLSISLLSFSLFSLHSNFRCTDRYARVRDCCNDCKRINKQIPKIARQSFVGSRRSEFPPNSFPGVFEMKLQKSNYSCSPYGVRAELLQFDSPEITGNRVERDLRWKTSGLLKCNRTRERGNEVIVFFPRKIRGRILHSLLWLRIPFALDKLFSYHLPAIHLRSIITWNEMTDWNTLEIIIQMVFNTKSC